MKDPAAIADILQEIARLLELQGENPFKVRAYRTAARALETLSGNLDQLIAEDRLSTVPGIGAATALKIAELHSTGRSNYYDRLAASVPPGLREMLEVPSLGPKKVRALHLQLGLDTLPDLLQACLEGRVAALPGFGETSQAKILDGIRHRQEYARRHLWCDAQALSEPILAGLRTLPQTIRAESAGSLRRGLETVGDLDFIVASPEPGPIMAWFVNCPGVQEIVAHGETKSAVRLEGGVQADLRVVPPAQFAFALHHFTGSKDHNVKMRQRALTHGLSLGEWGLTPTDSSARDPDAAKPHSRPADTEADIFAALGLHEIPPELREGLDEIERAEAGPFPRLVETADLRGALHNHTNASDGRHSLLEMAAAADRLGWEYLGLADHSKSSLQANGLSAERLLQQIDSIGRLNASGTFKVRLLAGLECDILAGGELDFPNEILARLDYVVASVHSSFSQSREAMTERVIRALENPHVTILGHATGRILLRREPYSIDLDAVLATAGRLGKAVELNANPQRLDLDWRWWRRAVALGVPCFINPDAHSMEGLAHVRYGVQAARKAGLEPRHVLNTRPLDEVRAFLARFRP